MRVTDSMTYRNFLSAIRGLNERLEESTRQVSSGKRLTRLDAAPAESGELVGIRAQLLKLDQYRANVGDVRFLLSVSEGALSTVHDLFTTIFTRGSAAASETNITNRAAAANEIRALRDQIFALANTKVRGRYVFAGSEVMAAAFTISGDTATYQGDSDINRIQVNDSLSVEQSIDGGNALGPVLSNIEALVTAIDAGDDAGIKNALEQFGAVDSNLGQYRNQVGANLARLDDVALQHDLEQLELRRRQGRLEDADMAEAVTELNRLQTALKASIEAGSFLKKPTLFDYLA